MGWRILDIQKSARLNYKLNCIGVVYEEDTYWINLDEIDTIVLSDLKSIISIRLIKELLEKGINVVVCDEKHTPVGTMVTLSNNARAAKSNACQLEWSNDLKKGIWREVIKNKISLQLKCLRLHGKDSDKLEEYIDEVKDGDVTNREGHAAKVYFRILFGENFNRKNDDLVNSSLNYTYKIIRSKIAQEIVANGYIPSVGIFHCNEYNYFNFADDIIEVFRPICDNYVLEVLKNNDITFLTPKFKEVLAAILIHQVTIDGCIQKLYEAIRIYITSLTNSFLKGTPIKFPDFYAKRLS